MKRLVTVFCVLFIAGFGIRLHAQQDSDCTWSCFSRSFCFSANQDCSQRCVAPADSCTGNKKEFNPAGLVAIQGTYNDGSEQRELVGTAVCWREFICGTTHLYWFFQCTPWSATLPCTPASIMYACAECGPTGTPFECEVTNYNCLACAG